MKTCTVCKKQYPETREYFYAQNRGKSKLIGQCKRCSEAQKSNNRHKRKVGKLKYSSLSALESKNTGVLMPKPSDKPFEPVLKVDIKSGEVLLDRRDGNG